jgi:hypothetical protein
MSTALRRLVLLFSLTGLLVFAGCASTAPGEPPQHVNVLGVFETSEANFVPPTGNTFHLSQNEVDQNPVRTGRQVKLFWGLITYTDY